MKKRRFDDQRYLLLSYKQFSLLWSRQLRLVQLLLFQILWSWVILIVSKIWFFGQQKVEFQSATPELYFLVRSDSVTSHQKLDTTGKQNKQEVFSCVAVEVGSSIVFDCIHFRNNRYAEAFAKDSIRLGLWLVLRFRRYQKENVFQRIRILNEMFLLLLMLKSIVLNMVKVNSIVSNELDFGTYLPYDVAPQRCALQLLQSHSSIHKHGW